MRIHEPTAMQLTRLVKQSGKAVWLLVLVPVLAVGASIALLVDDDPSVRTLATVSVIAPEGSSTAATVTQAVDGFKSTVVSDTVRSLASTDAGIPIGSGDVTAERVGTSNLVELRVTTASGEAGEAALAALIANANDALYSSAITSADARVRTAEQRYDAALDERARETERTGLLLPIEAYRAKAAEVTQLRVALAAGGPDINRTAVEATLERATRDLEDIGESVNAFESLEDSVVRAREELGDAKQESDAVETRRAAATAPESVAIAAPVAQSTRTTLVRGAVTGAVLGLGLAFGLVLLIGLLRHPARRTEPRPRRKPADDGPGSHTHEHPHGHDQREDRDYEAALT